MDFNFTHKKILVTGAGGYIGSSLVNRLLATWDCQVTAVVHSAASIPLHPGPKPGRLVLKRGDISTANDWRSWLPGQDYVFHLAGQTSHYRANADPQGDWEVNCKPILLLLAACQQLECRPGIVFASTATVYGLPEQLPVVAASKVDPLTIYDIHKLTSENYLSLFSREHGFPTISLRLANVYGPSIGEAKKDRGILNLMAAKALAGEELTVYGDGKLLRDYVYLNDVVAALLQSPAAFAATKSNGKAYNIATGKGTYFVEAVQLVAAKAAAVTGRMVGIRHIEVASKSLVDERNFVGCWEAFHQATGWQPSTPLSQGVDQLVESLAPSYSPSLP